MWNYSVMPFTHANGLDIHYALAGAGPRLLFINGTSGTLDEVAPLLAMFATQFEVLAHDQRGLGATVAPDGPYTMADYAADAAALATAIGWDRYSVLGLSFGGMVAQELAVTHPERIERLALMCTSAGGAGDASYPLHTLHDLPPAERAEIWTRILDTRFTPEWMRAHESDRTFAEMLAQRTVRDKPAAVRHGEWLQLEARSHHDTYARLPRISCPTLVAAGRYDGIAPLANSEAIAAQIPTAELRVYDGGHTFFVQDPHAFPEILDFLARPSNTETP